jgi:hypothetical protein
MISGERKGLWWMAGVLVLSAAFLCFAFTREDPWRGAGAKGILGAVIAALIALLFLADALLPPNAHAWVTRAFVGLGAVTATTCTLLLGSAIYANRRMLGEDFGVFGFIALIFAAAVSVSLYAWWAFFKQFKSPK